MYRLEQGTCEATGEGLYATACLPADTAQVTVPHLTQGS